jgi:cytochrome c oxidase assembly protein subunit 11
VNEAVEHKNRRLVLKLLLLVLGMVAFFFALIPSYDIFSSMTGINGRLKTEDATKAYNFTIDQARVVNLDFIATAASGLPLKFTVETKKLPVHPGQVYQLTVLVQNTAAKAIKVHANPSVSPGLAAADVKLLDCFCFDNQQLAAGEMKRLALRFVVDPKLPAQYKNIVLAQQFFNTK